jgi:hypothetical protein
MADAPPATDWARVIWLQSHAALGLAVGAMIAGPPPWQALLACAVLGYFLAGLLKVAKV